MPRGISQEQVQAAVLARAIPTWADVARAKAFFTGTMALAEKRKTSDLVDDYERHVGVARFETFISHPEVDPEPQLIELSGWLRARLAAAEAIAGLIQVGALRAIGPPEYRYANARWTTIYQNSGGLSGGVSFPDLGYALPSEVLLPATASLLSAPIGDPDVYVLHAGLDDAAEGVIKAIRDAQHCLALGLLEPSVAMLGKAMEGAWIEAGTALGLAIGGPQGQKTAADVANSQTSLARKIERVRRAYEMAKPLADQAGVSPDDLNQAAIWSHEVRKSRNAIHFDSEPLIPNTPEKVSVLFLAAPEHFKRLYRIRATSLRVGAR